MFNQGYYERFFVEEKQLGRGLRGQVFLCKVSNADITAACCPWLILGGLSISWIKFTSENTPSRRCPWVSARAAVAWCEWLPATSADVACWLLLHNRRQSVMAETDATRSASAGAAPPP